MRVESKQIRTILCLTVSSFTLRFSTELLKPCQDSTIKTIYVILKVWKIELSFYNIFSTHINIFHPRSWYFICTFKILYIWNYYATSPSRVRTIRTMIKLHNQFLFSSSIKIHIIYKPVESGSIAIPKNFLDRFG